MSEHSERRIKRAEDILIRAGEAGAQIVETTPKMGGLRTKDVLPLIEAGRAEWVVPFFLVRRIST
jgi:hypothetical protein